MDNINGIPLLGNTGSDFWGAVFPSDSNITFNALQNEEVQFLNNLQDYKWQTYWSNELSDAFFNGKKVTGPDDPIEVTDESGIYNTLTPSATSILYLDANNNNKYDSWEKISLKIKVFVSEDGVKLLRAWHGVIPKDDELLIFLENNKDDKYSGSQILAKVGTKAKIDIEGNTTNKNIFDWVNKTYAISQKELTQLLESTGNKGWFMRTLQKIVKVVGKIVSWPIEKLSDLFSWVGKKIERNLSIEEATWENPPPDIKKGLVEKEKGIENIFEDFFKDWTQDNPGNAQKKNISLFEKIIKDVIKGIYVFLENNKDKLPEILFATICGILNGIVDLIASIFTFIGMLLKLIAASIKATNNFIADATYYTALISEYFDTITQAISKINWEKVIKDAFISYFEFVYSTLPLMAQKAVASITAVEVGYYTGFIGINIIICFIPLVDIVQFAKIEKLAKPIQVLFEIITKLVKKTGIFVAKTVGELFTLFEGFTEILKKGTEELIAFVKKIFEAVKMWLEELLGIKPKIEDLADLSAEELDWMASREIGALGGKVLKQTQIRRLRGLLTNKKIQLIIDGDIKAIAKLFIPTSEFKTVEDLFFFMKSRNPPYVGMFNAETRQFFLSKEATEIVAFHEMAHVKHFEEVGEVVYKTYNKLEKEMYVWKQIISQRNRWTVPEIKDALKYINRIRTEVEFGFNLEPLKINL
jgi:hypothetical protein